jgi:hypothetical protein
MTLKLLHSEFPYIRGKFDFLFYQCMYDSSGCLCTSCLRGVILCRLTIRPRVVTEEISFTLAHT